MGEKENQETRTTISKSSGQRDSEGNNPQASIRDYFPHGFDRPNWKMVGVLLSSFVAFLGSYSYLYINVQARNAFKHEHKQWVTNVYERDRANDNKQWELEKKAIEKDITEIVNELEDVKCATVKKCR